MRRSGEWMVLADERILEYILKEGSGSPKQMADSGLVDFSRPYISRRCKKLAENGLLKALGNGVYVITEEGEAYLNEEYDVSAERYIGRDQVEEAGSSGKGVEGETEDGA
jgi:predicted transcriptional regulator